MIQWHYFPKSRRPTDLAMHVVAAFTSVSEDIDSKTQQYESNEVLLRVAPGLRAAGFTVEAGKKKADKISVPVLFGLNGKFEKSFDADAYHRDAKFVVEVEAGRAVVNVTVQAFQTVASRRDRVLVASGSSEGGG